MNPLRWLLPLGLAGGAIWLITRPSETKHTQSLGSVQTMEQLQARPDSAREAIAVMQFQLNALGFGLTPTGTWSDETQQAVQAFVAANAAGLTSFAAETSNTSNPVAALQYRTDRVTIMRYIDRLYRVNFLGESTDPRLARK